jgi:hypothetical protein
VGVHDMGMHDVDAYGVWPCAARVCEVWDVRSIGVNCVGVHDMDGRVRRGRAENMTFGQQKKKYLMTASEKNEKNFLL